MIVLHVTDRRGQVHRIEARPGDRLMFVLRDRAGLPVEGLCGGCMACGTCHVYVDPAWVGPLPPPRQDELDMLSNLEHHRETESRLSCQLVLGEALDNCRVTLAPEE
jgi:2Fe-2S ferredoxin